MDNELLQAIAQMMDEKLEPLKAGQAKLEAGQAKLEDRQSSVERELLRLNAQVAKIENDHGKKLGLLVDGHVALNEKLDANTTRLNDIDARLDRIEVSVGVHDMKLGIVSNS